MQSRIVKSYNALAGGMLAISFGAIFVRLAEAPAPAVAALRMVIASMILLPFVLASRKLRAELAGLSRRDASLLLIAGVFLALHFILWISSLSFTGVTSSVVLVTTSPLFVALYTILVLRERVARSFWFGLALALLGGIVIGGGDVMGMGARWRGDLLALGGAVAIAGYFLVGSRLRGRLSLLAYVFPVYACAAVVLVTAALAARLSFAGLGLRSYLYCFLLAFVCQVLGHSLFNYALKHVAATVVTFAVLGEPVGASILAFFILREAPALTEVLGGASILVGVFLVLHCSPEAVPPREEVASGG